MSEIFCILYKLAACWLLSDKKKRLNAKKILSELVVKNEKNKRKKKFVLEKLNYFFAIVKTNGWTMSQKWYSKQDKKYSNTNNPKLQNKKKGDIPIRTNGSGIFKQKYSNGAIWVVTTRS